MLDDPGWKILQGIGWLGASAGSAAFTVWKVLNRRFCELERVVQEHKEKDVEALTLHEARLSVLEQATLAVRNQVDLQQSSIVRLQAQHEETMRILERLDQNQEKLLVKSDTMMETMANVLLKVGH